MLPIQEKYTKYNFTKGRKPVLYIVVHDTGNFKNGANAISHFNFFNAADRSASADYFVDDSNILKFIRDDCFSWAVGDGKGKYGITNSNSISIEMCVNPDGNFEKTMENTLELIIFLMKKYNVPFERVVRHYDASRKNCPQTLHTNAEWGGWLDFKKRLYNMIKGVTPMTLEEAKAILKEKFGLSDETILYLEFYRYGEDLIKKLAQ